MGEERTCMQREDIKLLVKKWWEIYNDKSLEVKIQQFLVAFSEAGSVQHVMAPLVA